MASIRGEYAAISAHNLRLASTPRPADTHMQLGVAALTFEQTAPDSGRGRHDGPGGGRRTGCRRSCCGGGVEGWGEEVNKRRKAEGLVVVTRVLKLQPDSAGGSKAHRERATTHIQINKL